MCLFLGVGVKAGGEEGTPVVIKFTPLINIHSMYTITHTFIELSMLVKARPYVQTVMTGLMSDSTFAK